MITAHSGCDGTPDNSLEHVRHALEIGADALEIDLRCLPDGRYIITHDEADAGTDFAEVLRLVAEKPDVCVNVDCKEPGCEADVMALANTFGLCGRILFTGNFNPQAAVDARFGPLRGFYNVDFDHPFDRPQLEAIFDDLRAKRGGAPLPADFEEKTARFARHVVWVCNAMGVSAINIHYGICTDAFLCALRRAGIGVSVWTVNEEADIRRFLEKGVVNITTRSAGRAVALAREYEAVRPQAGDGAAEQDKTVLDVTRTLTRADQFTHISHPFSVSPGCRALTVEFSYAPKALTDPEALARLLDACYDRYLEPAAKPEVGRYAEECAAFADESGEEKPEKAAPPTRPKVPLVNLITLSVDDPDGYRGAAHRHDPVQRHVIGAESTPGFLRGAVQAGPWRAVVSVHSVVTEETTYRLIVREVRA